MKKEFKINNELYLNDIVLQTIEAFNEVAKIEFSNGILSIDLQNEHDIEEVFNEFSNYMIGLINE